MADWLVILAAAVLIAGLLTLDWWLDRRRARRTPWRAPRRELDRIIREQEETS